MRNKTALWLVPILLTLLLLMAMPQSVSAQDEPTIAKDSVEVALHIHWSGPERRGNVPSSWSPAIKYRVNGPIASGSRLWVEFSFPGKKQWLTGDCRTAPIAKDESWNTECLGSNEEQSVRFTGMVDFAIHVSNELQGTNLALFRGKMKVAKRPPSPQNKLHVEYYVDEDWRIPIGYLSRGRALNFEFALPRGHWSNVSAHLFHQGKQVAEGINCAGAPVKCEFFAGDDALKELNPGEYEVKVLNQGRLARSAKFTVAEDGSYDNGIATANKLGSDKVIVPVKVIGEQEGPWDKLAWKTGAFYGNPLAGFTAPP